MFWVSWKPLARLVRRLGSLLGVSWESLGVSGGRFHVEHHVGALEFCGGARLRVFAVFCKNFLNNGSRLLGY